MTETKHAKEIEVAEANVAEVVNLLAECAKIGVDGVKPEPGANLKKN